LPSMPIPANHQPITRSSMREEVYNTLLNWIMEGELRPGEKILDKDLAAKMGVSRTPVREALRRLEDKDLVVSAANRWTRVAEISSHEAQMIYPVIWALEELAISLSFDRLDKADRQAMARANDKLARALRANDPLQAFRADVQFHQVYINKSENSYVGNILRDLKIKYRRIEVTYFGGSAYALDSVQEHRLIVDALKSGDLAAVQAAIRNNWQNSLSRMQAITPTN